MSDMPTSDLERQLSDLTTWSGQTPGLWRRAVVAAAGTAAPGMILRRRIPPWLATSAIAAAILVVAGLSLLPSVGRARHGAKQVASSPEVRTPAAAEPTTAGLAYSVKEETAGRPILWDHYADADQGSPGRGGGRRSAPQLGSTTLGPQTRGEPVSEPDGERQVIRKATIELATKDVRAAFLKAAQLISEARGEYVQDSGLTGEPNRMEGNLTLRVSAERLSEVLNELRQLGEVRTEKTGGEDVTTQVVDLEARLRNEQRVETEMLQLLEKRQDAPLKEILELRGALSGVRQTIEQLTGQRERLGRLVSLATVLVIIRPADAPAPPPPADPWLGAYFIQVLGDAWHNGVVFLVDTLVGLLSVLIGGLIWWVLLVIAILWVRAYYRRRRAASSAN